MKVTAKHNVTITPFLNPNELSLLTMPVKEGEIIEGEVVAVEQFKDAFAEVLGELSVTILLKNGYMVSCYSKDFNYPTLMTM